MRSMTGFGRCETAEQGLAVALRVSSVNRKSLEVVCSLPKGLQQLDQKLQQRVRSVASRGRFQFSIEVKADSVAAAGLPSDAQFDAALERLRRLAERHEAPFSIDSALLVQLSALLEEGELDLPDEASERLVLKAVDGALEDLVAMREREGAALLRDLRGRAETMQRLLGEVRARAPEMVARYREVLFARLEQAGLELDLGDERVLREIALFADRCDVSEEITRLGSHLEQLFELLGKSEPVGRPLEFLLQEMGREVNTCGSKSSTIEVSRVVLEMKNELERLREQVANVE